jgi:tetratricopeptide (TPR) repeat protein
VIGLVQVGSQSMADRYSYVPSIGVFIAIVWSLVGIKPVWPHLRMVYIPLAIAVVGLCWFLTTVQVSYWQSSESLARHALAVTSNNATMEDLLGLALFERGEKEEALQHAEAAVRIWPNDVDALHNLAMVLDSLGRFDEAIETCQAALVTHSGYSKIHYILAHALLQRGKLSEAIREYKATLQIEPENYFAMNDLAWLMATAADAGLRDGSEAVRLASRACGLTRYRQTIYIGTLAAAYAEEGDFNQAIATAQQACKVAEKNGETNLFKRNQELLNLYLAHKTVRE